METVLVCVFASAAIVSLRARRGNPRLRIRALDCRATLAVAKSLVFSAACCSLAGVSRLLRV